ncbi:MAG: rod shape-determining protein MreD [Firmicutes bacterium]|nr:rod shape-determining protein MreD [Bacillota bacterium]
MISLVLNALIGFIVLILQSSSLRGIAIGGILPDLLLLLTVSAAMVQGERRGSLIGFVLGLLEDLLFFRVLGFYALIYMLIGFSVGYLSRNLSRSLLLLPVSFTAASSFAAGLVQFIFLRFLKGDTRFDYYLFHLILPEVIYTLLLGVLLLPLLIKLNEFTDHVDEVNAQKRRMSRRIRS